MSRNIRPAPAAPFPFRAAAGSLLLAVAAAYANSLGGVFVLDDQSSIIDNPAIRSLRHPLAVMFSPLDSTRPLVALSLALNFAVSGLAPWSYHVFNILVHGLAAAALFALLGRALPQAVPGWRTPEGRRRAWLLAWAAALIWATHPLQTQAVTYVIQRAESMMGLFFLLSLGCVVRALETGTSRGADRRWQMAAVAACWLSMACKQVAAAAPVLALLYDRSFASGGFRPALRRRPWMYLGMFASYALVPIGLALAVRNETTGAGAASQGLDSWAYLRTQFEVVAHYLRLSLWPAGLCLHYAWPIEYRWDRILPPALLLGALGGAALWSLAPGRSGAARAWGFAGAWFFVILAPTSSILPITDLAFEQRMYLPLAAIALAAALALFRLCRWSAGAFGISVAALALVLGALTLRRNADYRSYAAIWEDTARKSPLNAVAFDSWGFGLEYEDRYEEALARFREAERLRPDLAKVHVDIGHALDVLRLRRGGPPDPAVNAEMEREYREALRLEPRFDVALFNLGLLRVEAGDLVEARDLFQRLVRVRPDYPGAHYNLAIVAYRELKFAEAVAEFAEELRYRPDTVDAWCNLAVARIELGRDDEAREDLLQALRLYPDNAFAHFTLGRIHQRHGRAVEALAEYQAALRLKPDYTEARQAVLALGGQP